MSDSATHTEPTTAPPLTFPTWAVGVPAVLLLGFLALLGRAGVGIQILGLPLGAYLTPLPMVAVGILLVTRRGRALIHSFDRPQRRVAIAVGIAVGAGVLRAAAQGTPTLLRFQDMAYLLHLPWIIVGMSATKTLRSDEERLRVLRWIAWTLALVLTFHWAREIIAPVGWLFEQLVGGLGSLSDKPADLSYNSSFGFYAVALAALSLGYSTAPAGSLIVMAGALLGTHLSHLLLGGSRGALLGVLLGGAVLFATTSSRASRRALLGIAALFFLLSTAVALTSATLPPAATAPAATAWASIRERYEILAGRRSVTATLAQVQMKNGEFSQLSTVSWRIAIWLDIVDEWNTSWTSRLFGIGFGTEIAAMTVPGRQGFDGLNRGVHNIAFTILARQGITGILTTTILLFAVVGSCLRKCSASLSFLTSALTISLLDVFLEGVNVPVALWFLVGLTQLEALSASRAARKSQISIQRTWAGRTLRA